MSKPTYEELEAQVKQLAAERDAVVAENVALKQSEIEFNNHCRKECELSGDEWVDDFTETPATNAFLASLRAEGVEMFGRWLRNSADIFDKNERHDWADQDRVAADKAKEFAAHSQSEQVKGVQGE